MKRSWQSRFVLTTNEKRVLAFMLIALVLGVMVKQFRAAHPVAAKIDNQHRIVATNAEAPKKSRRKGRTPAAATISSPHNGLTKE
ncbi:MAG: hypothetical protein ABJB69_01685 [Spartobacteria bacterium]